MYRDSAQVTSGKMGLSCCENVKNSVNNERLREPASVNFCGLSATPTKLEKLYANQKFQRVLKFAKEKQIVFSAGFALVLTCILRPASIILLPSKKNKEDQIYASAHSIASGVIGFALSSIILDPLTNGIEKFNKDPEKYIKNKNNFLLRKGSKEVEDAAKLAKGTSSVYLGRLTDLIPAIPKGILTVALIPPILKYIFGIEKKKKPQAVVQPELQKVDVSLLNFKSAEKVGTSEKNSGGVK